MKISNEVKIGITIVVAIAVAYVGFKLLQDSPLFGQSKTMFTYYEQVQGLTEGTPVFAQGVKIGTVRVIKLASLDSVKIEMSIDGNHNITDGAVAVLESTDILGTKAISIRKSDMKTTLSADGYIRGVIDEGLMGQMSGIASELGPSLSESTGKLGSVLSQIDQLLQEGGQQDISQTLSQLNRTTSSVNQIIEDRNRDLTQSIETLNSILSNIDTLSADRKDQFDRLLNNLETTSSDMMVISDEFKSVGEELNQLLLTINEGDGTLNKLLHDPALYNNLDSLSYNINELVKRLNDDPKYFFRHFKPFRLF